MPIDVKGAAKGAGIGGVSAGVIGVALYFAFAAMGANFRPKDPAAMGGLEVLPFFQPVVVCLIATAVAIGVVALLSKVTPDKAWTAFLGVAAVVFAGEGYAPFWAFDDAMTIAALETMHVPATLGIVGGIWYFGVRR